VLDDALGLAGTLKQIARCLADDVEVPVGQPVAALPAIEGYCILSWSFQRRGKFDRCCMIGPATPISR